MNYAIPSYMVYSVCIMEESRFANHYPIFSFDQHKTNAFLSGSLSLVSNNTTLEDIQVCCSTWIGEEQGDYESAIPFKMGQPGLSIIYLFPPKAQPCKAQVRGGGGGGEKKEQRPLGDTRCCICERMRA